MVSLSFKDEHGNPILVQNSQSDIEINIPTGRENGSFTAPTHFINPGNDSMAYHTFNITYDDTAFSIRIQPVNETRFVVYLRHGKRPNETHFDYEFLVPDFSSCLPPEDENCSIVAQFMQCLGADSVPYHRVNFTKPDQPTYCGPPKNDSVPKPAPPENGEEEENFKCPDMCRQGDLTFTNCSCDEIPDISFLFPNATIVEDVQTCRDLIDFTVCPNDTMLCKNSVNLLSCYLLQLGRFEQCREILTTPRKLFYDLYGKCLDDPFKVFFNHTVGKPGKWYVGVKVYIPPFINDTEDEEQEVEEDDDFEDSKWWEEIRDMTEKDEVKEYLNEYIVARVSAETNSTVELDDRDCRVRWWWWWWSCKRWVSHRLKQWTDYIERKEREDNERDGRRKRRSLSSNSTDSDLEIKAKRLCILVKEKPPPPKIGEKMALVEEPEFEINVSSSYSFDVKLYTCLFWDEVNDEWSTKGCKVELLLNILMIESLGLDSALSFKMR